MRSALRTGTAGNAGVVARGSAGRRDVDRRPVVAVERLLVPVAGRADRDPAGDFARSLDEVAEERPVAEIPTVVRRRGDRQHAVRAGVLRRTVEQNVVGTVALVRLRLDRAALRDVAAEARRHDVEVHVAGIDDRQVDAQERPAARSAEHLALDQRDVRCDA